MRRIPPGRRWMVGVAAGLVAAGTIAYTVVASRAVLREVRSERQIAETRHHPDELGYFSFLNPNRRPAVYPSPAAACSPEAMADVERATNAASTDTPERTVAAIGDLERALRKDGSCVAAGRLLMSLLSSAALQVTAHRFVTDAEARPADAAAQLLAAYYERYVGDADGFRRFLESASAARPDQPLLHGAWATYWGTFANPRSTASQLRELHAEVEASGDLGAIAGLMVAYGRLHDDDVALHWCDRFYEALPDSRYYGAARWCVEMALRSRQPEALTRSLERFWRAETWYVGRACMHSDLAYVYRETCHPDQALAEADRAIADGCDLPARAQRRAALAMLGRWPEAAAEPALDGYWGTPERATHALVLALSGQRERAIELAAVVDPGDDQRTPARGSSRVDRGEEALFVLHALLASGESLDALAKPARCEAWLATEADRLAVAAGKYAEALMTDDARTRYEKALALEPRHGNAWGNKIYALSLEARLDEAAAEGDRGLALGVDDGGFLANLGYVHEQRGDCARAVELFRGARARLPLRAANYTNLAKCLDLLGRGDEADEAWRFVQGGRGTRGAWWLLGAIAAGVVVLYVGVRLALTRLLAARTGRAPPPASS